MSWVPSSGSRPRSGNEAPSEGLGPPAAPARASPLRRARLVVHDHGHAGDVAQHALRLVEPIAMPHADVASPTGTASEALGVLGADDDALHALGFELARERGHVDRSGRV